MLEQVSLVKLKQSIRKPQFNNKADLIKCLGDPTCLKILFILNSEKMICPSDLSSILKISMPAISHQLARLKQMGIVENKRMGQMICYSFANTEKARLVKKLMNELV